MIFKKKMMALLLAMCAPGAGVQAEEIGKVVYIDSINASAQAYCQQRQLFF